VVVATAAETAGAAAIVAAIAVVGIVDEGETGIEGRR
jgi:hypothetical protein